MQISVENGHTMILTRNIIFLLFFCVTNIRAHSLPDLESNDLNEGDYGEELFNYDDVYSSLLKGNLSDRWDKYVIVDLFYEVHCPYCINFYLNQFAPAVETLSPYFYTLPLPFGNAKMIHNKGKVEVKCQHGPAECYGNKLHACSVVHLKHSSLLYNACLMNSTDGLGSDDKSADRCGKLMNVDPEPIKKCAKGKQGETLLLIVGKISHRYKYSYVPYVRINGKVYDVEGNDFKKHICADIRNPPPACKNGDKF